MYYIYRIQNKVNGKSYIGFTNNIERRMREHKHDSFIESGESYNYTIHKAIRKYGWENFLIEILYTSEDKEQTLEIMEPKFILEYNTFKAGYNDTLGGQGGMSGKTHTVETRAKMSTNSARNKAWLGKKMPDSAKLKMSQAKMNKPSNSKGKKRTPEQIQKMSAVYRGKSWYNCPTTNKRIWVN